MRMKNADDKMRMIKCGCKNANDKMRLKNASNKMRTKMRMIKCE